MWSKPGQETVFVLGAGFSAAMSSKIPITNELGDLARERLIAEGLVTAGEYRGGTFEEWLSRLAEDQPDLDEADNLANRSRFVRLSGAIAAILSEREQEALAAMPASCEWLLRFVGVVHAMRATAITFNYDTLIEHAVEEHVLYDWATKGRASHVDVIDHLPQHPPGTWGEEQHGTFRLLKLHGSLNWYWSQGDTTGGSINRWSLTGRFGVPGAEDTDQRARLLPARTRFIVPPTATKSTYYTNPFTRELWRRAARAISQADSVYLVGYSFHLTELVSTGMLRERLRSDATVCVVNRSPDEVVDRLTRLGIEEGRIDTLDGVESVSTLVHRTELEVSKTLVASLGDLERDPGIPVTLAWGESINSPVVEARLSDRQLLLLAEAPDDSYQALSPRPQRGLPPVLTQQKLLDLIDRGSPDTLRAVFPDGREVVLIDSGIILRAWGAATRWLALVPSAGPPPMPLATG